MIWSQLDKLLNWYIIEEITGKLLMVYSIEKRISLLLICSGDYSVIHFCWNSWGKVLVLINMHSSWALAASSCPVQYSSPPVISMPECWFTSPSTLSCMCSLTTMAQNYSIKSLNTTVFLQARPEFSPLPHVPCFCSKAYAYTFYLPGGSHIIQTSQFKHNFTKQTNWFSSMPRWPHRMLLSVWCTFVLLILVRKQKQDIWPYLCIQNSSPAVILANTCDSTILCAWNHRPCRRDMWYDHSNWVLCWALTVNFYIK